MRDRFGELWLRRAGLAYVSFVCDCFVDIACIMVIE